MKVTVTGTLDATGDAATAQLNYDPNGSAAVVICTAPGGTSVAVPATDMTSLNDRIVLANAKASQNAPLSFAVDNSGNAFAVKLVYQNRHVPGVDILTVAAGATGSVGQKLVEMSDYVQVARA